MRCSRPAISSTSLSSVINYHHDHLSSHTAAEVNNRSSETQTIRVMTQRHEKEKKTFFEKEKLHQIERLSEMKLNRKNYIFAFGEKSSELEYIMMALPSLSLTLI